MEYDGWIQASVLSLLLSLLYGGIMLRICLDSGLSTCVLFCLADQLEGRLVCERIIDFSGLFFFSRMEGV